ncbi:type III secretion protein U [Izhakiella capsodis]|uniref:Type III secretion protein U n=1 Tax=Izhakiella capsodis TaxID=1367852 RepID=A0A1I5AW66_9GAMM|nr:EscU/YscU/HrcU family type III secretion system export apparatus switch protein [Izhakiella capsodis]SFN66687.1 type III secretion protein U [Izhakiella capsodis]
MAEKTEKPTSKRRKDSAKKGQTFKSKDLITTLILLIGIYFLTHFLSLESFVSFYTMLLRCNTQVSMNAFLLKLTHIFILLSLPFISLCVLVGFTSTLLQTRFSVATEVIKLNFKALNFVEGIKKIFSIRTVKELVRSLCYLLIFVLTCYSLFHLYLKQILVLYRTNISGLINCWMLLAEKTVFLFIGWSILLTLADIIAEYFLHFKDIKMEKHEVKQEHKELEGNPQIKSARRQSHLEILSVEEMTAVRNSEVILANPTHIAIAIYFNPDIAALPFIALRCSNMKAKAAIAYAEKMGIPVVRNILLTRRIYKYYQQFNFISVNDDALIDVMKILIWLKQVEVAGMTEIAPPEESDNVSPQESSEEISNGS